MEKKIILITGGSSGIGLTLASVLNNAGYHVVAMSRSREKIQRGLEEMPHLKGAVDFIKGDISNEEDIQNAVDFLEKTHGVLHGLVNNAAILSKGTIETTSVEEWRRTLDINLTGTYMLTKALLPLLRKAGGASVVNVSSVAGLKPGTSIAYSVSKAGLDMLTKFLAGDLGPYNIRVNSVNPGLVRTNIHLDNKIVPDQTAYENMIQKAAPRYPVGRIGKPEDIAEVIAYLLSDKASWITGSVLPVDGGVMVENDLIPPK